jgi:hemerythrin-like domain-containing protein
MTAIELMMNEHRYIKRMLKVMRKYCWKVFQGEMVDMKDFYDMIDFVRNYADKHHHKKEEDLLFKKMGQELGKHIKNGPVMGMMLEHDLGRHYMANLEKALQELEAGQEEAKLDIIANAISYTDLLAKHIDKEDNNLYQFANLRLSKEGKEYLEQECKLVEDEAKKHNIQQKYIELLERLERN